ncbi:CRISPR-associated endonuclease Cas4g/Cas1g [Methanoplanus endosymbiosus]|uniref:CRISPR-associated endonuclease Cas1 n=1 Tax=Methanoplanus endosymbiosus TaxID=33865 RepID=A0A9E7THK0_9EURY|nr:CRISPR-associated endonuclease Cas1 [Methanoplanus endosymbiosus]UUX93117.1 CRISPR-associated endonuclease Cas1 [Methanoplanus endosymbiosus]
MDGEEVPDLIPARMLNEFTYCPRLCYIEWVQGEFEDNADTVDGRFQHRRVDQSRGVVPDSEEIKEFNARSVDISAPETGIICRLDLVGGNGKSVTPVEYKRGSVPDVEGGAYESDKVQLCAQGLALKENGYECSEGMIYFVKSKRKVSVPFDDYLINRTKELLDSLREMAASGKIPPPLIDSPKCIRCSISGICLPDEINSLRESEKADEGTLQVRKFLPARDDQVPLYVSGYGQLLRKKGERIEIWSKKEKLGDAKIRELSQVSLYGGVSATTPVFTELLQRNIPISYFSYGGWFYGFSQGNSHKNVELRIKQFSVAGDNEKSLKLAQKFVNGKILNCRTILRRNDQGVSTDVLSSLKKLANDAESSENFRTLLGIEGGAAQIYFSRFNSLLKSQDEWFLFNNRNRRPPKDPVNAVLSYLYGVMVKEFFVTLLATGFDPYLGFYHQPRYGRPALALDLMEEFRPIIADSVTFTLFNNGELSESDFICRGLGVTMTPEGKKTVLNGYERRINTEVKHPLFGYKVSYRRIFEVQARLIARVLDGEIDEYPPFLTR